jgi:hypothetical protein
MPTAVRIRSLLGVLVLLALIGVPAFAQMETATLSGVIQDPNGRVVPDVEVTATRIETGTAVTTKTNGAGIYFFTGLMPGHYHLTVRKPGFKEIAIKEFQLYVQDKLEQNFALEIGSVSETVTVSASDLNINTTDATVSTVVDRQFAENLPMNGRSFQTLIQLTPGVVLTTYNESDNGQFSVNGQRASSNYWMVDGVSANVGIGTSNNSAGNGLAGANAGFSVLGGTNSLVSVDAMQEFRIQTSTFAPEFGRTPGGQISIVTRSGTSQWHGSIFDYLRNDVLDANDWFANYNHLSKPKEQQNDFGGTFSGPILKDRTFFFFSYEGLRLRLPQIAESLVPDLQARQTAVPAMQPFLNAFPLPSPGAPDDPNTEISQFNASFSNAATLDAYSLRVDHKLTDKLSIFGRYNYSPSASSQGGACCTLNSTLSSHVTLQTGTAGVTWTISPSTVNDLRFNYSRTHSSSHIFMTTLGSGVPLTSLPFPSGFNVDNGTFLACWVPLFPYCGPDPGFQGNNLQRQINIVESLSVQKGAHSLKYGVDFRRLSPVYGNSLYAQQVVFLDVPGSTTGSSTVARVVSAGQGGSFFFHNLGAFAQDTWRISPALTVTYGLRWDVDFAPSSNPALLAVTGFNLNDLSNLAAAPIGTPPFQTGYGNVAPRVGVAYHIAGSQNWQTVLRSGFGLFYDLATSEVGNAINPLSYPFGASTRVPRSTSPTFPYSPSDTAPPPITAANVQTFGAGGAFDPHLKLPYSLQWNVTVEQALGAQQTLSASYIGSAGKRLLQTAQVFSPNTNFSHVNLITNAATSDYNSLQLQFQRRLYRGLQVLTSYTWSHSIDSASAGSFFTSSNAILPTALEQNRGSSDFDIRNAFSLGATYDLPAPKLNRLANAILQGWSIENIFQARSAPPITVYDSGLSQFNTGFSAFVRPDIVPGQAFYLYGSNCNSVLQQLGKLAPNQGCPGGKGLNPAAFVDPPTDANGMPVRQGDLGRNALRGFDAWQWDFAVHRDFPIREAVKLQFRVEMFNTLNHPNFAPFVSNLSSGQFGLSTKTLGQYLAGFNTGNGAFNPLYQVGGPRSVQFSLKLTF